MLTVANMCCYVNTQCLTNEKNPPVALSFQFTSEVEWNVLKSVRVDKTDDSKFEIQNKEFKYTPNC